MIEKRDLSETCREPTKGQLISKQVCQAITSPEKGWFFIIESILGWFRQLGSTYYEKKNVGDDYEQLLRLFFYVIRQATSWLDGAPLATDE